MTIHLRFCCKILNMWKICSQAGDLFKPETLKGHCMCQTTAKGWYWTKLF
jgi:hypothetical protein